MGDHNIDEDVKEVPKSKHSYEEPGLAQQTDRTSPTDASTNFKSSSNIKGSFYMHNPKIGTFDFLNNAS